MLQAPNGIPNRVAFHPMMYNELSFSSGKRVTWMIPSRYKNERARCAGMKDTTNDNGHRGGWTLRGVIHRQHILYHTSTTLVSQGYPHRRFVPIPLPIVYDITSTMEFRFPLQVFCADICVDSGICSPSNLHTLLWSVGTYCTYFWTSEHSSDRISFPIHFEHSGSQVSWSS